MARKIWDKHEIKAAIHRRGMTLARLALESELEPSACWVALIRRNRGGERAISQFLGVPLSVLWPSRYPAAASRVASNTAALSGASQNEQAA